jgi:hypothetical protein
LEPASVVIGYDVTVAIIVAVDGTPDREVVEDKLPPEVL